MTWLLDPRQKRHFMHLNLKATFYNLALKVLQSCNEVTTLCRFSNRGKKTKFLPYLQKSGNISSPISLCTKNDCHN